ncbi:OstA-like protein [Limnovirga soli]|uniref:Organic solvent tolerance-like N-terminal domain-containing protein n=1 Tax=Limnovirga soli TaxID=2656915 RepID=A0A8J8FGP2_9BACT|nr:OstA-like protein [Limnovirga soli]NNV57568.1 hypothetical protein [Limnovirga soli]
MKGIYTLRFIVCIVLFCFGFTAAQAQQPVPVTAKDSIAAIRQIIIIHADRLGFLDKDSLNKFQTLAGKVAVQQETSLFYCDSASINTVTNVLESFGHVHINDNDSLQIYSDYLKYLGKEKKAKLTGNVKLTDGKGILTTSQLDYDMLTKIGVYTTGGKVVNDKTTLTSKEAFYYEETRDVYFKKNVVLVNPDYTIKTDTLVYNTYTGISTFVSPTYITSDSGRKKIYTTDGYYDTKNKKAYFGKRPEIQDGSTILIADDVANDDSTGFGEARGRVVYKDTVQNITLLANHLNTNRKDGSFLATEKPVMIIKQENDSIFIAADTMYSAKLSTLRKSRVVPFILDNPIVKDSSRSTDSLHIKDSASENKTDSSDRFFEAYYHVRIYSDSLQAVGDSLFYSAEDSVFRLFKDPVVWARDNQITGDTIYLYTENKKPKRLFVFENALAISKVGQLYYNQIKGRTINGDFTNGDIHHLRAKGNSESIYYGQDDYNKFIGVNKASSDIIDMYFESKKPERVVFRSNLQGITYPMRQVNHEEIRLRGFKWLDEKRPKTKYSLFEDQ